MSIGKIERHIVPKHDYPMVAKDLPLFTCPSGNCKGKKLFYNVAPGQLVAYTYPGPGLVPISVDNTNVATTSTDIYLGIGWDSNGDGLSDDIRLIAGEHLSLCQVEALTVGKPDCGSPGIKAASIDCVKCDETYTAKVTIDDNRSRSWGPIFKTGLEFTATYTPECGGCTDCPADANCKDVICGIVDALNGELDLKLDGIGYPDWKDSNLPRPYKAVRGHDNWYTYCITPDAAGSDCENCNQIDALTTFTLKAGDLDEVITDVSDLVDPTNAAKTIVAQLDHLVQRIECAFNDELGANTGFAYITKGATACCPLQLHVVTCDDKFEIDGLTPCDDAIDPATLLNFVPVNNCVDCGEGDPAAYTPACWFAIIAQPQRPKCDDCYLDKSYNWYGVDIKVEFLKDAYGHRPITKTATFLEARSPRNFGSQIQWLEYKFGFGPAGRGRRHRASNYRKGFLNKWDDTSRIKNAVTAKCEALYCSYTLEYTRWQRSQFGPSQYATDFESGIHVQTEHTVTLASLELFLTALVEANNGLCRVVNGVNCIA
jgi:hypothetical protein